MTEDVIQYIWQTQSFDKSDLQTTDQERIIIYDPGSLNHGSGPDFSEARIKIDKITWSGDVEIHSSASHWQTHGHNSDNNYDKVVLHVVWQEDKKITRADGSSIPTLELRHCLDTGWYAKYKHLMSSLSAIPCQNHLQSIDSLIITEAIQTALIKRLETRSATVLKLLNQNNGDWEQTTIQLLFSGFGFNKNKEAFQHLASRIDLSVLRRLRSILQVEAYLFGLSGLLSQNPNLEYVKELKAEFDWLDKKYNIKDSVMSISWWKFMRMRPSSFPTRRVAQLAFFLSKRKNILRSILEDEASILKTMFDIPNSKFWQVHYHFNSESTRKSTGMGLESQRILLINVVTVVLVAYGKSLNKPLYIEKAVELLESLKPESNNITRLWGRYKIKANDAADSQGLIELFNNYCKKSRCLSCSIGEHILQH